MLLINNQTPFVTQLFSGFNPTGQPQLTAVIKASFNYCRSGKLKLAENQQLIQAHDTYFADPKISSIQAAEESMPFKHGGELLITGRALPDNNQQRHMTVVIEVKKERLHWKKILAISGQRYWYNRFGQTRISQAAFLKPVPLQYEYAYGGADPYCLTKHYRYNPIGLGFTEKQWHVNHIMLPHIEIAQQRIQHIKQRPLPAGTHAIAKHWEPRLAQQSRPRVSKPQQAAFGHPPANLHNVAPRDQQFRETFKGGEAIRFSGLTRGIKATEFITLTLPHLNIMVKQQQNTQTISWDTLTIDTNKQQLTLVGRHAITGTIKEELVIYSF